MLDEWREDQILTCALSGDKLDPSESLIGDMGRILSDDQILAAPKLLALR